jgi:hypothetical protein
MSIWKDLFFDTEFRQRRDINTLRESLSESDDWLQSQSHSLRKAHERIEKLELVCEALFELMQLKGIASREELSLLVQRIDLADGFEDGKIGPDRTAEAPSCGGCQRPVNPKRKACLYCGEELSTASLGQTRPPAQKVICAACQSWTLESEAYFSGRGLLCVDCFAKESE